MTQRIQGVGLGLLIATAVVALAAFGTSFAQNTPQGSPLDTSFTYQGRLEVDGVPANGFYDFAASVFDAQDGGSLIFEVPGAEDVLVTNGHFSIPLSVPSGVFSGEKRYIEISVRPASVGDHVSLGARQELTPAPYAIYAMTAGEVSPEGAASFIQNGTTQQPTSNFNISGNGTAAGTLSANVFALDGLPTMRRFGQFGGSLAVGPGAGSEAATGIFNTMLGAFAGSSLTSGNSNTGIGGDALKLLSSGSSNTAVGDQAGQNLTTGTDNVFIGATAARGNFFGSTGSQNVAVGSRSGFALLSGGSNALFGDRSGELLTTGSRNTILGKDAGAIQTSADDNVFVGHDAGKSNISGSQNVFLGREAGRDNTTGVNTFVGFQSGLATTSGAQNVFLGYSAGFGNTTGGGNTAIGSQASFGTNNLTNATVIGAGASAIASNQIQLGRNGTDTVRIGTLGVGASSHVCFLAGVLADCSSSLRYKTNLASYTGGLDLLAQLRPVTFDWKSDGTHDLGFVAEDVAAIDPLLATYRDGVVEGVKYDRISAVLVNSVMEQQDQIDALASGVTPADDARLDALEAAIAGEPGSNLPGWLRALAGAVIGSLLLPGARKAVRHFQ